MTRRCSRAALVLSGVVALVMVGCRSAAPAADVDDRSGTEAVAALAPKRPFEPPDWESTEYRNEDYGFRVHYPSDYESQPPQNGGLFTAASAMQVPRLDVTRSEGVESTELDAVAAGVERSLASLGGGEATVVSKQQTTLSDGVTEAMELVVDWTFQGFPLQSLVLATGSEGGLLNVMVTGMQGGDIAELSEIAYTLYFD